MPRSFLLVLSALLALVGCATPAPPTSLVYNVVPTDDGVLVEVHVETGPPGRLWVGFGVGPGVPNHHVERIEEIRAWNEDGEPIAVNPHGYGGFEIARSGSDAWTLSYRLRLRPSGADANFYRASVRGPDYAVLVGSDAWPRLYVDSRPLAFAPDNRPPGRADRARVTLDVPVESSWEVLAAVPEVTRRSFRFVDHPATTVILAGDFRAEDHAPGVAMRVHTDWSVLQDSIASMTHALASSLRSRLGVASSDDALAVMLPLPDPLRPPAGLRTAGMVRGRTALLYGGLAPGADPGSSRIAEAMAVFIGHELFHLYVPSAVPVARDLSWMSEGWAMHMGRLAALDAGFVTEAGREAQLRRTYRRYLDMGGYRAGSLPDASMGTESQRDLLYLRGELAFRLLAREWDSRGHESSFEEHLWRQLTAIESDGPLASYQVSAVLEAMVGREVVRRYVEGTAPLTQGALGFDR